MVSRSQGSDYHRVSSTEVTLLRLPDVSKRVGLRRAQIYRLIAQGTFPAPVRLSVRTSAWRSDAIAAWITSRDCVVTPSAARRKNASACSPTA